MAENIPRIVKVQLVVAFIALLVTIGVAFTIPQLIETKQELKRDIELLEERKAQAEASLKSLVKKINEQATTLVKDSIKPRVEATKVAGVLDSRGRQIYDFRLWIETSANLAQQIDKVKYTFDHPTFTNKVEESSQSSNGFSVSYRGWGCLYLVSIEVLLKDGRSEQIYFDMCGALS